MRDRLRPSWAEHGPETLGGDIVGRGGGPAAPHLPTIGIHIRANGHLFNKRAGNNFARYELSVLRQNDIGLGGGCQSHGASDAPLVGKVAHDADDFGEFWETALDVEQVSYPTGCCRYSYITTLPLVGTL